MKISVITAAYNSQATIASTIESFLGQSHPDKEMLVIDGASKDDTLRIVESFGSNQIRVVSETDSGVFDAMNKGLHLFEGDAVGFLNSDDTFHDAGVLGDIAAAMSDADIVYGDIKMVMDHRSKRLVRSWRGGKFGRYSYQLGWGPPHTAFYMRRALALNDFRVRYLPRVIADFAMGGISTRSWRVSVTGNLECLRSRRQHLNAPVIDAALFLRLLRRIFQLRKLGPQK